MGRRGVFNRVLNVPDFPKTLRFPNCPDYGEEGAGGGHCTGTNENSEEKNVNQRLRNPNK